jgi:hypothetical protein
LIRGKIDKFTNDFIEWLGRDFEIKKAKNFPNPSNLFAKAIGDYLYNLIQGNKPQGKELVEQLSLFSL